MKKLLVKHNGEIIAQTQGTDAQLEEWLAGDSFKYPEGYTVEYIDITAEVEAEKALEAKVEKGRIAREKCQKVLDLIAGFNLDRALTIEQISEMQATFADAEKALRSGRPDFAHGFISAIHVDGILVTQEMKDLALSMLV